MDKATEIAKLEAFAAQFDHNAYVGSFLSAEMVAVIANRIRADTSCDILRDLEYAHEQKDKDYAKYTTAQRDLNAKLTGALTTAKEVNDRLAVIEGALTQEHERLQDAYNQLSNYSAQIDRVRALAQDAWLANDKIEPELLRRAINGKFD